MANLKVEISPIWPDPSKYPINKLKKLDKALERAMTKKIGPMLKRDMEKTTQRWQHAPSFVQVFSRPYGTRMQVVVAPAGRYSLRWAWISEGTGPRVIHAKPGKMMVFPKHYAPKTTPSGGYVGPGKKYGPIQVRKRVYHTIEPRKFSERIAKKRRAEIFADINVIIRQVGGL